GTGPIYMQWMDKPREPGPWTRPAVRRSTAGSPSSDETMKGKAACSHNSTARTEDAIALSERSGGRAEKHKDHPDLCRPWLYSANRRRDVQRTSGYRSGNPEANLLCRWCVRGAVEISDTLSKAI